jgi:hypothetical protein
MPHNSDNSSSGIALGDPSGHWNTPARMDNFTRCVMMHDTTRIHMGGMIAANATNETPPTADSIRGALGGAALSVRPDVMINCAVHNGLTQGEAQQGVMGRFHDMLYKDNA